MSDSTRPVPVETPQSFSQIAQATQHQGAEIVRKDDLLSLALGSVVFGTIIDVEPHGRCYRVQTTARATIAARAIGSSSFNTVTGTNDISIFSVGTSVMVYFPLGSSNGFILGAVPSPVYDSNLKPSHSVAPGSDVGSSEAPFTFLHLSQQFDYRGLGIVNYSGGTMSDQLPGDWGSVNELGGGVLVSKMISFLRASPDCGVFAFHLDNLLRVHGYNYEHHTSTSEHRIYNDEGEVHDVHYRVKFPWEALGLGLSTGRAFDINDDEGWKEGSKEVHYEPRWMDQTGLWRDIELRGYLGDLQRTMVALPDLKTFTVDPILYSANTQVCYAGLSEFTRGADGRVAIRSAKEILFCKYAMLPVPHQVKLPDDNKEGDWRKNYKASGELGEGGKPPEQKDWTWTDDDVADTRAGYLPEYLAFVFNWYKFENVVAHKLDWFINQESEHIVDWFDSTVIGAEALSPLRDKFWAKLPKKHDIDIDSRIKQVHFYESMSCFSMLDDGSIIIEDGWGSSIIMTKGHIQLSAAGDVFMRPGRSFYAWAPKDAMLRAGGSIDLTATARDIRLKAECNLHLLAGNDGPKSTKKQGGILLESRSAGMTLDFNQAGEKTISGGVVVKCTNSDFVTWANNIYLGTKKIDKSPAGTIFLSADEGKQNIFVQGAQVIRDIRAAAIDIFEEKNVNYYRAQGAVLDSRLVVRGAIAAVTENAGLYVAGSIAAVGGINTEGSLACDGSVSYGGDSPTMVMPNKHALKGKIKPAIDTIATQSSRAKQGSLTQGKEIDKRFQQNEGSIGSAATVKKVSFSLRINQDYKADDFKITLSRWQQMCSELGVSTDKWIERPVLSGGTGGMQTYPFPGRFKYEGDALYAKPVFKLFSFTEGHAVDREPSGGPYATRTNSGTGGLSGLNDYPAMVAVENA